MWKVVAVALVVLIGCMDQPDIIIEDEHSDIVVEHVYHYEEDTTPDIIREEDSTPDVVYIIEEDTTPDVVREFYSDASDLPVLLWTETGEPPMPKKLTDLTAATALADADQFWIEQSGTSKRIAASVFLLPLNYIAGLITSNNGTDADHDIDIAAGVARSDDDTDTLRLAATLTKQIDAAWAVGTNQGGLDTGSVAADTLYAIWLIKRSDTGVVDAIFSTSFSSPTMPANYDKKRLIAAVLTDVSPDLVAYTQVGDYFRIDEAIATDITDSSLTSAVFETGTLRAPPNCIAEVDFDVDAATAAQPSVTVLFRTNGTTRSNIAIGTEVDSGSDVIEHSGSATILTDGSSQIQYAVVLNTGNPDQLSATVSGFTMLTRRDP